MFDNFLKLTHVLSIVVWVGGMAFAHFFLRPALGAWAPPERLRLMREVLGRFFRAVLVLSSLAVVSGLWMVGRTAAAASAQGGAFHMPLSWTVMGALGLVMWGIFGHIRFALYKRLAARVDVSDWPAAGMALAAIRRWVGVNLVLGGITVCVALLL